MWNLTNGSLSISLMSILLPSLITSGCFFIMSQPMWAKRKPRFASWGSAVVSENLWWTRWSLTHSNIVFWNNKLIEMHTINYLVYYYHYEFSHFVKFHAGEMTGNREQNSAFCFMCFIQYIPLSVRIIMIIIQKYR